MISRQERRTAECGASGQREIGVLGRARTCDLRIRNPLLFRLSYEDSRCRYNNLELGTIGVKRRALIFVYHFGQPHDSSSILRCLQLEESHGALFR